MAVANSRLVRSTHPQQKDTEFFVVRPGDRRLAVINRDESTARWEADVPGPVFLIVGVDAPAEQLARLADRWCIPIDQLHEAVNTLGGAPVARDDLEPGFFYVLDYSVDKTGELVRVVSTHPFTSEGVAAAHERDRAGWLNGEFVGVYGVQPVECEVLQ